MYFVRKNPELSVPLCYWALLGHLFLNVAKSIVDRDSAVLMRALGNCVGLAQVVAGRFDRIGGILK